MAITASDILFKLSVTSGSAGNSTSGTVAGSLGKYISTTQITDNSLDNLIASFSGTENANSTVKYKCFFIHNAHATLTAQSVVAYLSAEASGGASAAIGVDTTAASAIGSASSQALTIADENTAPAGVSFSSPTTAGTGISVGNIAAGSCRAVWVRATAANTSAKDSDGVTISVQLDTAA